MVVDLTLQDEIVLSVEMGKDFALIGTAFIPVSATSGLITTGSVTTGMYTFYFIKINSQRTTGVITGCPEITYNFLHRANLFCTDVWEPWELEHVFPIAHIVLEAIALNINLFSAFLDPIQDEVVAYLIPKIVHLEEFVQITKWSVGTLLVLNHYLNVLQ